MVLLHFFKFNNIYWNGIFIEIKKLTLQLKGSFFDHRQNSVNSLTVVNRTLVCNSILNFRFHTTKFSHEFTNFEKEVISGLLLSDGHLGKNRLQFTFKASDIDFIRWLKFEVLGAFCTQSEPTPYPKQNPTQYWFGSKSDPYFVELREKWYVQSQKILPKNFQLTAISLAFMIMGDGYWEKDSSTIFICTENFTLEEVNRLIFSLRHDLKLAVATKKRGKGFRLRFSSQGKNLALLRELVIPYMHVNMLYKLGMKSKKI
jgi:hypothetical protein